MDNTKQVSPEDARRIEEDIRREGGNINEDGEIGRSPTIYTETLERWLTKYNAFFWHCRGKISITNWPPSKPLPPGEYTCRVTTTQAIGNTRAEGLVAAVITEGEYKGRIIPIKLQSEDCQKERGMYKYDSNQEITLEGAKAIQRYIRNCGGDIDRNGVITGNFDIFTRNLVPWITEYHASIWFCGGRPQISNWVAPLPVRKFEVNVDGCVTECEVERSVNGIRGGLTVRVKEVKDC